jgi:kynureninase
MSSDALLKYRPLFPILETSTYLVSHSLGAMPRTVYDQMKQYADTWASRGVRAWSEGWWDMPVETGNLLAKILDAPPGSVVMHQNVSVAESVIASALEFRTPRNRIVYTEMNFPTVQYVWEACRRRGAETLPVRSRDGMTIELDDLLAAIDERTLVVEISHVLYKSGFLMDAAAIIKKAHSVGALVVLDCYQSTGTVPYSVRELDVDIVVGGSVKWLCGGPGAGYLYVRPDLWQRLEPTVTGWAAHDAPFAFETGAIRYAPDIRRFLHGSPAIPALYAARAGYQIIHEAGVGAIREKSLAMTNWFFDACVDAGFKPTSPKDARRRGGTVTVSVDAPGAPPIGLAVKTELERREIVVDFRPGAGIRVSPHFYNTKEELERFLREARNIVDTKAYEKHLGKGVVH